MKALSLSCAPLEAEGQRTVVRGLVFAPDAGTLFALLGNDVNAVEGVWYDLREGKVRRTAFVESHTDASEGWCDAAVSPDLSALAWPGHDIETLHDFVRIAAVDGLMSPRRLVLGPPEEALLVGLAFAPGGEWLAAIDTDAVHLFHVPDTLARPAGATVGPAVTVRCVGDLLQVAFTADGRHVVALDDIGQVLAWSLAGTAAAVRKARGPGKPSLLATGPGGRIAVVRGARVRVWPADMTVAPGYRPTAMAFDPAGRWLAVGTEVGTVAFFDANTGTPGPKFDWRLGSTRAVAFAPDGLTCAAGGDAGRIAVWDVGG